VHIPQRLPPVGLSFLSKDYPLVPQLVEGVSFVCNKIGHKYADVLLKESDISSLALYLGLEMGT